MLDYNHFGACMCNIVKVLDSEDFFLASWKWLCVDKNMKEFVDIHIL